MTRLRMTLGALAALAALTLATAAGAGTDSSPRRVEIRFTGQGGGRYLDVTRWLRDDTRD
jgi:ABC-type glycerol-3-phosphate transport system substrate-binding protein